MLVDYQLKHHFREPEEFPKYLVMNASSAVASATVTARYKVPINYDLHLHFLHLYAVGGAAQTCTVLNVGIYKPQEYPIGVFIRYIRRAAPLQWEDEIIPAYIVIPSEYELGISGTFSAGVAVNEVSLSGLGYLVTRTDCLQG